MSLPKNCRCEDIQGKAQHILLSPTQMEITDLFYDGLEAYDSSREDFVEPENHKTLNQIKYELKF